MKNQTESTNGTGRMEDGELERLLRAYAGARLSPDQWASLRMRAAVIEHGRAARAATRRASWRSALRVGVFVSLVAILAIGTGASAALAASPGGPLFDTRLWIESAIVSVSGGSVTARSDQMNARIDEITNAVDDGNANAAGAAGNAYGTEVGAAAQAAQNRSDLVALRATITRHLAHLQSLSHASSKAQANLDRAIANAIAALAQVDSKLAALPPSSPSP